MKKLNNKGFTLVELLAVIIILAIVVGISIPAITSVINDSKDNALGVAVDAAEKYFSEQYSLMQVDYSSANGTFVNEFKTVSLPTGTTTWSTEKTISANLAKIAGFESADVQTVKVKYDQNGAACVMVTQIPVATSKFYTTKYWQTSGAPNTSGNIPQYKSKSC